MSGLQLVSGQVLLLDEDGHPIAAVADDTVYRLLVEASIKPGSSIGILPAASPVRTAFNPYLTSGGSENLLVNGATTPVAFSVVADPDDDLILQELRLVMVADAIEWGNFGKGGGVLTNGILIEAETDGAAVAATLVNLQRNEGFFRMQSPVTEFAAGTSLIGASVGFGGSARLAAGSGDFVRLTVRDDLTSVLRKLQYFTATLYTNREDPA